MDWDYFDKFENVVEKYMPSMGEGETIASQIVTAVNKLIYKWYNDGDVFDNTYHLEGWCNDLSSYANWLYENVLETKNILSDIVKIYSYDEYEKLLANLADLTLNEDFLGKYKREKIGTIYKCNGVFEFVENDNNDDDDWWE